MAAVGPAERVPLPGKPSFITYGSGSVWVVGPEGTVWRVHSETGQVLDTLRLDAALGAAWPAFGHGSVWMAQLGDGVLVRIDPESSRVLARIPLGGGSDTPMSIAFSADAVWVANQPANTISRVEAGSNKVVETIDLTEGPGRPLDAGPSALAVIDDQLWISEHRAGSFGRRPIAGGTVTSVCHGSPSGGRLAATDDALWLVDAGGPVLSTASIVDGSVSERFFLPGPSGGQIAVDGNEVWVASGEYLVRFDAATRSIDALARLPKEAPPAEQMPGGLTLALGPQAVWTTHPNQAALLRFPRDPVQ